MSLTEILKNGLTYPDYRALIDKLLLEGKTTGANQTEKLVEFTRLNVQRMNRLDKTIKVSLDISSEIRAMNAPVFLLVVGDAWCGDCAQIIPVINKIAEAGAGKIELKIVSRDSYPEFTEEYQAKSIPKVFIVNKETKEMFDTWGSRPQPAREIMLKWKNSGGAISKEDFEKELHLWYAKDKGVTIMNELRTLLTKKHSAVLNQR